MNVRRTHAAPAPSSLQIESHTSASLGHSSLPAASFSFHPTAIKSRAQPLSHHGGDLKMVLKYKVKLVGSLISCVHPLRILRCVVLLMMKSQLTAALHCITFTCPSMFVRNCFTLFKISRLVFIHQQNSLMFFLLAMFLLSKLL